MKFVIDRFEGDFAIVELSDGRITQIPRIVVPPNAKEGDIILLIVEVDETANRKASIEREMESLFKD